MLRMRDISNYQATVDVDALKEQDVHVVAVKATEGTGYESPAFGRQWQAVENSGMGRIAYHYFHPSISAVAQMRHFLNVVENYGLESDDCLALDLEETDGLPASTVAEAAVDAKDWIENETKGKLLVYTYINFADAGNCNGLGDNPLWLADPSSPPGSPRVPEPWKDWTIHQYGIIRGLDADILHMDNVEDLFRYAVLPKPPPLQPDQRIVWLSDGETQRDSIINIENLVPGFSFTAGKAEFRIIQ